LNKKLRLTCADGKKEGNRGEEYNLYFQRTPALAQTSRKKLQPQAAQGEAEGGGRSKKEDSLDADPYSSHQRVFQKAQKF